MLPLHKLQSFVAVVEAGSFTAAAGTLGLSKAALSLHVKQLEEELGTALLARTTRRVTATEAGERLHRAASKLLRDADQAESEARGEHLALTGTLRITSLAEYLGTLVPALAEFAARHPRLRLELFGAPATADLVRDRFDLAIRLGSLRDSSLQATRLARFRLRPVATPELLARHGTPRHPDELARLPWVLFELPSRKPGACLVFTDAHGATTEIELIPQVGSDSSATVLAFARAHGGAALLPDWLVRDDLATGRLVPLLPGYELPEQGIFAVRPRSGHVPVKVRRFVDFLRAWLDRSALR